MTGAGRRLTFYLGIAGMILMLLLVGLSLMLTGNSVEVQGDDPDVQPQQVEKPSPPAKEPPLNR